jgi:hypothetical protein
MESMIETLQKLWQEGYVVSIGPPRNIAAAFECKVTKNYKDVASVVCGYGTSPEEAFQQAMTALVRTA